MLRNLKIVSILVISIGLVYHCSKSAYKLLAGEEYTVTFMGQGLLKEKTLISTSGHKIILLAMMHVGDESFYQGIKNDFYHKDKYLVLTEGVRDAHKYMKRKSQGYFSVSEFLKLSHQDNSKIFSSNQKNADMSYGDFDALTRRQLTDFFEIMDHL